MRPVNVTWSSSPSSARERAHLVEAIARAHEYGVPVVRAEVPQRGERLERVVDAVLGTHDAQVAQEVLLAPLERGIGDAAREAAQIGGAADDEDALGRLAASLDGGVAGSCRWWR